MTSPTVKSLQDALKVITDALTALNSSGSKPTNPQIGTFLTTLAPQLVSIGKAMISATSSYDEAKQASCLLNDKLNKQVRQNKDLLEDTMQSRLTGKVIVNIMDNDLKRKIGLVEQKDYRDIDADILTKAISKRYNIDLTPRDLSDIRRTARNGNIMISFYNLKAGSPYHALCLAMKAKGASASGQALYVNFALTSHRNEMLWHIRKSWKDKNGVEKFYVDYDGGISIVLKNSTRKTKVASVVLKEFNFVLYTLTIAELKDLLQQQQN